MTSVSVTIFQVFGLYPEKEDHIPKLGFQRLLHEGKNNKRLPEWGQWCHLFLNSETRFKFFPFLYYKEYEQ